MKKIFNRGCHIEQLRKLILLIIIFYFFGSSENYTSFYGWQSAQASIAAKSPYLIVKHNGNIVLKIPVQTNQEFGIKYIHSVALTPVEDIFIIKNNKIKLEKTIYKDFGAGLPHALESNQKMIFEDGHIKIDGYKLVFDQFDVRVGRIANHKLILYPPPSFSVSSPFLDIPLKFLAPPGSALTFTVITN